MTEIVRFFSSFKIAIQRLIISHDKWKRKLKLQGFELGRHFDSVIVQSKSTLGIFDDALEQESDVGMNDFCDVGDRFSAV